MPTVIALIGPDGTGKSTQVSLLALELARCGIRVALWRNAGGRRRLDLFAARLGLRDSEALLGRSGMLLVESAIRWLAIAWALLWSWATGRVALMDRYSHCQYASIRARTGRVERFARWCFRWFPQPVLTCYLALSPSETFARIEARGTDHEDFEHLRAVDAAYRQLPEAVDYVVVDASGTAEQVAQRVRRAVAAAIPAMRTSGRAS